MLRHVGCHPSRTFRPRGFAPPRRFPPTHRATGLLHPAADRGVPRVSGPMAFPAKRIHTPQRIFLVQSRIASPRPLPPCRFDDFEALLTGRVRGFFTLLLTHGSSFLPGLCSPSRHSDTLAIPVAKASIATTRREPNVDCASSVPHPTDHQSGRGPQGRSPAGHRGVLSRRTVRRTRCLESHHRGGDDERSMETGCPAHRTSRSERSRRKDERAAGDSLRPESLVALCTLRRSAAAGRRVCPEPKFAVEPPCAADIAIDSLRRSLRHGAVSGVAARLDRDRGPSWGF